MEWPALALISQKDVSNLVYGNNISVGKVLLKTKELVGHVASTEKGELEMNDCVLSVTEEAVLQHAIGILRNLIAL